MKTRKTREKELTKSYYEYITGGNISELHDKFIELQKDRKIILPNVIGDIFDKLHQYRTNNDMISGKKLKQLAELQAKNTIDVLYAFNQ